ncbi:MAG: zinc ribbon domain-containing protein, partial [Porticoccaceae bacterium]|nr:zinc ribbon domain-containing protein [Porticoccaceae bacterium]
MPIYEYQCDHCGHQFDAIQKFSDAPLDKCPSCEELALRKKISAP